MKPPSRGLASRPHCSISVPGEDGDELLSLFAGASLKVQAHREARIKFERQHLLQGDRQLRVRDL
eukprot:scaffold823_cov128-Isochrysis_galbana.AAC.3